MPGREGAERLGEDATRTFRIGTEESADSHLETNLVPKGGFLGETASVAAVDPPGLVSADGTGCFGVGRGDSESQVKAIEVGADQATADRGMQKLSQKQERPPKRWGSGFTQSGRQPIYDPGSSKVRENPFYALISIEQEQVEAPPGLLVPPQHQALGPRVTPAAIRLDGDRLHIEEDQDG